MADKQTTDQKDAHTLLADVIKSDDKKSTNEIYNKWGETYERDMAAVQYFAPRQLMEHWDKLEVPKDAKILDICAGTGANGRELAKLGYTDLHAFDGAEGMLANARKEGNYKSYSVQLFEPDSKLPYEDKTFDCVIMTGVFAPGHLPIVALREACRVAKVGAKVCFVQCDPDHYANVDSQYADKGFQKLVDDIAAKGIWKCREGFPIKVSPYIEYSDGFIQAFDILS